MNKINLKYYCKLCKNPICSLTAIYGSGLCRTCCKLGKLNGRYKNGNCLKKIHCIDCKKELGILAYYNGTKRCHKCAIKKLLIIPIKYYCKICNKEITYNTEYYGTKLCRSCSTTERLKNPKNHPMTGKKQTKRTKSKISLSHGGTGIPYENNEYSQEFRNVIELIRDRDNHECCLCNIKEVKNKSLAVHHIDYNKENCLPENLISLCNSCHSKTMVNRDYWFAYFTYKIKELYGT